MARPRLRQISSIAVFCFAFASAGYMMYLVYSQYQVHEKLHKSFLQRNLQESEKKALAIGYFLSERLYDMSTLAESRNFSMYYENSALGMSVEYGLGATIGAAQEMLSHFRQKRILDGQPIFSKLLYVESSGKVLFESSDRKIFPDNTKHISPNLIKRIKHAEFSCESVANIDYFKISFPFLFKGRYTGRIVGWIPAAIIRHHFVESVEKNDPWISVIAFRSKYLFGKPDSIFLQSLKSLPNPSEMTPGKIETFAVSSTRNRFVNVQAFITPISESPFSLVSFQRIDSEGSASSQRLFYILAGIGLALLAGGIAFFRINMHSAVLETRLEETRVREKIVREKNNYLRKLRTALEQSSCSVVITDVNGTIEYVNAHFSKVTGYSTEESIGQNPRFLKSGKEPMEKYRNMWQTVMTGKIWSGEFLNRKKGGELYWEQSNIAPVMDENGVISSFIAIKEDITERKLAEQELCSAKESAEAANQAKSAFLANMSHEIRTPMNGIIGMTDLCLSSNLDNQQRSYLRAVRVSAENLLAIINDILDFSKIEAGKIEIDNSPFFLRTTVGQALRTLAPRAAEKNLEIIFDPAPRTPDALLGDPIRLKQVIINLVGNAVKFSENGQIFVSVSAVAEDTDECTLFFSVTDSGIGISPERQSSIFDPFEQGDQGTTKVYGGTGLGLSISKKLVELMAGTIQVASKEGKGSIFTFTVRVSLDSSSKDACVSVPLEGKRVVIVDDSTTNRRVLADFLNRWGIISCQAENAVQTLDILKKSHQDSLLPDFLLIDVQMPDCDGWQLVRQIRSNPDYNSVHCIIMPSLGMDDDSQRCVELQIEGYLPKPIVHGDLHDLLVNLLDLDKENQYLPEPIAKEVVQAKRNHLSILIAEDVAVNQEVLRAILGLYGHTVTIVDNGADAVSQWERNSDQYDLILMDVQMPLMDGLSATRKIRELEKARGSRIPIVAMTAYAMKGDREKCLAAGMDNYVSKPFKAEDLVAMIDRYGVVSTTVLDLQAKGQPREWEKKLDIQGYGPVIFNRDALLARIYGREEMVAPLVEMFSTLLKDTLPELEKMLETRDSEKIRQAMHTLAGASSNIGAEQINKLVTKLHAKAKNGEIEFLKDEFGCLWKEFDLFRVTACADPNGG